MRLVVRHVLLVLPDREFCVVRLRFRRLADRSCWIQRGYRDHRPLD